jgi:hypothetical protein
MNIPAYLSSTCFFSVLACLLCGCASIGHDFKYQNTSLLELKQTHRSDCEAMFGKPTSVQVKNSNDGRFESLDYLWAHAVVVSSDRSRRLRLEFRDGVLNAYLYASNFEQDKSSANVIRLKEIIPGKAKKEDVLRIVGKPFGKVLCPSSFFKSYCQDGTEAWLWSEMARGDGSKPQVMLVFFDQDGVVTKSEASPTKN